MRIRPLASVAARLLLARARGVHRRERELLDEVARAARPAPDREAVEARRTARAAAAVRGASRAAADGARCTPRPANQRGALTLAEAPCALALPEAARDADIRDRNLRVSAVSDPAAGGFFPSRAPRVEPQRGRELRSSTRTGVLAATAPASRVARLEKRHRVIQLVPAGARDGPARNLRGTRARR